MGERGYSFPMRHFTSVVFYRINFLQDSMRTYNLKTNTKLPAFVIKFYRYNYYVIQSEKSSCCYNNIFSFLDRSV